MKVIVAGSRTITDKRITWDAIDHARSELDWDIDEIVSGLAKGPDTHGKEYGHLNNILVAEFPADWNRYGRSAGYRRNREMAVYADALVAVHDGQSKGTQHMIDLARNHGLTVLVWAPQKENT